MKHYLLAGGIILATASAQALQCEKNVAPNPGLCRILYAGAPPCSGLYLGGNKVLTAGHCLVTSRPRAVSCANGFNGRVDRAGTWIHEEYLQGGGTPESRASVDLALLSIVPEPGASAAPGEADPTAVVGIPASATEAWELVKNGDCTMNGVGRDNEEQIGEFQSCASSPLTTNPTDTWFQTLGPNFGKSSDSGGPLICRSKSGQLLVAGVLSRGQNAIGSTYFAPVHRGKLP